MKINNETVYVIYHNGNPYEASNRKTVYTKRGSANGVITTIAKEDARYGNDYWNLNDSERKELVEEIKKEFTVVEYKPVKEED